MSDRLVWVKEFISRDFYAPFIINHDSEYYNSLCDKYSSFLKTAKDAGADEESIHIIENCKERIQNAIKEYYKGNIGTCHNKIKNIVKECSNHKVAVNTVYNSDAFPGDRIEEIQFFRARLGENTKTFVASEMLHLPFELRGKTGNYRFSIPGVPSLYLANSSYGCWIELGRPADYFFNVSPVVLDGTQKIFNLAVMQRDLLHLNELEAEAVRCWLRQLMLMIATSYCVMESNRTFKSEYIVSQGIMLACKNLGLDGVAYYSKRVDDEIFAKTAVNLALFAPYKAQKRFSEMCQHIKVGDSFNYSTYKQLNINLNDYKYELRIRKAGRPTNIGSYKRQFDYKTTSFCYFDQFLFSSWSDKDEILWGNALT